MRKLFLFLNIILLSTWAQAQDLYKTKVLSIDSFMFAIREYNPIAKIADIQVDKANADLQTARGAFDPSISYSGASKTLNGKDYYSYNNPELKIPTPLGIDVRAGMEYNSGNQITREATLGRSSYIGLDVNVLKGMLLDSRRAALRQSKIFSHQSEQERLKIVNDLMFDAYIDYWEWAGSFQTFKVYSDFLHTAKNRLRLIRISYQNGSNSLADTVEAATQVQSYELQQAEALMKFNNAQLILSNYLWTDKEIPYELSEHVIPDTLSFSKLESIPFVNQLLNASNDQNPNLKIYDFKLQSLEVERKLKRQSLLPTLKLKANLLSKNYFAFPEYNNQLPYLYNNYKWGLDFSMPLFFRAGRGAYRKAKLKIKETNYELQNKMRETDNKIRYYHNEVKTLLNQIQINKQAYNNYKFMLRNENLRFQQGETSLFLINTRENKVLASIQKQIELQIKYQKANYALQWAAGLLK